MGRPPTISESHFDTPPPEVKFIYYRADLSLICSCLTRMREMTSGLYTGQTLRPLTSNPCRAARWPLSGEWRRFVSCDYQSRPFLTSAVHASTGVITGNVINRIYPVHPPSQSVKRAALAELGAQLDHWYAELPDSLAFDSASSRSIPPPNVLMMHTTYWNTVLLLHRAL